jgi:hypothetical protein
MLFGPCAELLLTKRPQPTHFLGQIVAVWLVRQIQEVYACALCCLLCWLLP